MKPHLCEQCRTPVAYCGTGRVPAYCTMACKVAHSEALADDVEVERAVAAVRAGEPVRVPYSADRFAAARAAMKLGVPYGRVSSLLGVNSQVAKQISQVES